MRNRTQENDQVFYFKGAKIKRKDAYRVTFALLFGFGGIIVGFLVFGENLRNLTLGMGLCLTLLGYFYGEKRYQRSKGHTHS
jgi:hypothetical protein